MFSGLFQNQAFSDSVAAANAFDRRKWPPDLGVIQRELDSSRCQLGPFGGGNHFIEILVELSPLAVIKG